jgi:hypothetical protein
VIRTGHIGAVTFLPVQPFRGSETPEKLMKKHTYELPELGIGFASSAGGRQQTMISTMVRTLSRVPMPLRSLAVCVACEECFDLGDPTCPSCGSDEYVPLLHQLEGRILNMTSNN